jgi:alkyldihydroxyacetonephosphate synthase
VFGLYDAIRSTLRSELTRGGTRPLVMAHVSHLYATGASLYFTVLAGRDDSDPDAQWQRAKERVTDVIASAGATVTHHHAVGTDHRPWLDEEIGPLGIEVLRAVKSALDPAGILNPGKLIPDPKAE